MSAKSNGAAHAAGNGASANGASANGASANGASADGAGGTTSNGPVNRASGTLIIIGGHEDKEGDRIILRALAERARGGALVVVTAASNVPDEVWGDYEPLFRDLGVDDVRHLHVDAREEARDPERVRLLDGATVVFITGGNQLKLTSQLGDTPVYERMREIYEQGGCIAGTSAGASVVSETMMVTGDSSSSPHVEDALRMAPGFGFLPGVVVDQHFAERGRIGRLIGAVAQNPRVLGVGVDEDTAIVCEGHRMFTVLGSGGVYVLDGRDVTHSNLVDEARERTLGVFGLRLHLLNTGDTFDLSTRRPECHSATEAEARLAGVGAEGRK